MPCSKTKFEKVENKNTKIASSVHIYIVYVSVCSARVYNIGSFRVSLTVLFGDSWMSPTHTVVSSLKTVSENKHRDIVIGVGFARRIPNFAVSHATRTILYCWNSFSRSKFQWIAIIPIVYRKKTIISGGRVGTQLNTTPKITGNPNILKTIYG